MKNIWILTLSLAVIALLTVPGLAAIQPELSMAGGANFIYNPSILASSSINSRGMPAEAALAGGIVELDKGVLGSALSGHSEERSASCNYGELIVSRSRHLNVGYGTGLAIIGGTLVIARNLLTADWVTKQSKEEIVSLTTFARNDEIETATKFFTANISTKNISTKDSAKNVSAKDLEISRESFPKDFSRKISAKV